MPIIKEQIKFIGDNMNLKINLSSDDSFLGYQQEIDNLTQVVSVDLINPETDLEERRYKYANSTPLNLRFQFYNQAANNYQSNFLSAGFTTTENESNSLNKLNSFFILDFYDTYDPNTQVKILTTYITKLGSTPTYLIGPTYPNQIYCWYVPVDYIKAHTGATTAIGYTKFSFYNAKDGTITLFYNLSNAGYSTPEKMYFKSQLDFLNKTWRFILSSNTATARELTTSPLYNQRINNTVDNINNEEQNYPSGSAFDFLNGKYF
jgi:hypothetical protein